MMLGQFYLHSKKTYLQIEKSLDKQLDLLWIADLLRQSVHNAGFTPCLGIEHLQVIDTRKPKTPIKALRLDNGIQVARMREQFNDLIQTQGNQELIISKYPQFNSKRPLIIADCQHAEIHRIAALNSTQTNQFIRLQVPLLYSYGEAYVGEWIEEQWFIRKNKQGKDSLYYRTEQTDELSSQVQTLEVKPFFIYGRKVLELTLGMENQKSYHLTIAMRNL